MASSSPEPGSPFNRTSPAGQAPSSSSLARDAEAESGTRSSTGGSRLKRAAVKVLDANAPRGMWQATGQVLAKSPTVGDIRRGSFSHSGWTPIGQSNRSRTSSTTSDRVVPLSTTRTNRAEMDRPQDLVETPDEHHIGPDMLTSRPKSRNSTQQDAMHTADPEKIVADTMTHTVIASELHDAEKANAGSSDPSQMVYPNGYKFPPKHTWGQGAVIALKGFWKFCLTPVGFLITVYGLNVVAWGGMLFLLLLNAAPAMCHPTCNDINSPRRKWIEIDSQILNALFCVTGFGLIPWRFRDFYHLLNWRIFKNVRGLRTLAGIHRGWFRLPGSQNLPPKFNGADETTMTDGYEEAALALPVSSSPDPPLTGHRASPTAFWKLDFVIWMYVLNTFLQAVLCGFMWGQNRYNRPSWSTGTFVALACIVAGIGGLMVFLEGKKVKKVEGVPVTESDLAIVRDLEQAEGKGML